MTHFGCRAARRRSWSGTFAGHDLPAAVAMGHARNVLRALAIDRQEPPGRILARLDAVLSHLEIGQTPPASMHSWTRSAAPGERGSRTRAICRRC